MRCKVSIYFRNSKIMVEDFNFILEFWTLSFVLPSPLFKYN